MSKAVAVVPEAVAAGTQVSRSRYCLGIALLFVTVMLVGFAPTFYLRPLFRSNGLPLYLLAHGASMTAWFALFAVQAWLVSRRNVRLHRTLGIAGAVVATLVVVTGFLTLAELVPRRIAAGAVTNEVGIRRSAALIVVSTHNLVVFGALVGAGLALRRRPDVHKRLMLLGAIVVSAQPFARGRGLAAALDGIVDGQLLGTLFLLFCLVSLCAHDYLTMRRVHRATIWGVAGTVASAVVAIAVAGSELGLRWAKWLSGIP